jgi:hypothetical protein
MGALVATGRNVRAFTAACSTPENQEGRTHRLHAQVAYDPQCDNADEYDVAEIAQPENA